MTILSRKLVQTSAAAAFLLSAANLAGSVVSIGPGAFPGGTVPITFTGLSTGTEVNGLTVGGVLFNYLIAGTPTNGDVQIDGGPGVTNNITPPNIVSIGIDSGILRMTLPSAVNEVGFGYAILNIISVANAATISVYNGSTFLGTLSYNGAPDPTFTGGFAGLLSSNPFNRVDVTFNSAAAPAFAADNILLASVPEPSVACMVAIGAVLLLLLRKPLTS